MVAGAALCSVAENRCQRVPTFLKMAEPRFRSARNGALALFDALELETSADGVVGEHLYGLERVVIEVLADQRKLLQDVIGYGDHLTSDRVGVEDVQQFARARPDQLGSRRHLQ